MEEMDMDMVNTGHGSSCGPLNIWSKLKTNRGNPSVDGEVLEGIYPATNKSLLPAPLPLPHTLHQNVKWKGGGN